MAKKEISYKASLPHHQAIKHLENLVASLKKGSVCLQVGEDYVLLKLDEVVPMDIEVEASEKKGKNRLSLELAWREVRLKEDLSEPMLSISRTPGKGENQAQAQPEPEAQTEPEPEPEPEPAPETPAASTPSKTAKAAKKSPSKTKPKKSPPNTATTRRKARAAKAK